MWLGRKELVINIVNRSNILHLLQFWAEVFFVRVYGLECQPQAISGINATLEIHHSEILCIHQKSTCKSYNYYLAA